MATFFTQKVISEGNRHELYVYFQGQLIYKVWYVAGQKQYSKLFHAGEGAKASVHENEHAS
jgi:hypothetical protein